MKNKKRVISILACIAVLISSVFIETSYVNAASFSRKWEGSYYQVNGTHVLHIYMGTNSKEAFYTLYDYNFTTHDYISRYNQIKIVSSKKLKHVSEDITFKWKSNKKLKVSGSDTVYESMTGSGLTDIAGTYKKVSSAKLQKWQDTGNFWW